jgi:iron(III) transport system permease protein
MIRPARQAGAARPRLNGEDWLRRGVLALLAVALLVTTVAPLGVLLAKSFQDGEGRFVGLSNYLAYFQTPALFASVNNSLVIALSSALIAVTLAFVYAYALARSAMSGKALFRGIALIPLLAPSLLPAIALVYLFGKQGLLKGLLFGETIYGPIGIVIGEVFWTFPHALILLVAALSMADARLYEAAESLGASRLRVFFTVTLPGAKYGLVSAFFVVFALVITDFGVPKVIGGQTNLLATDIYRQVVGQQNFSMGAVVGMILLLPALFAFVAERIVQSKQILLMSARAVPYRPQPNPRFDFVMLLTTGCMAASILAIIGVATYASLVKLWPYDLSLTLKHYRFDLMDGGGWPAYVNSLTMAGWTALVGTVVIFIGAYVVEKTRGAPWLKGIVQAMVFVPLAVPGLVLGLAYIFFFNAQGNPLGFMYHGMAILVMSTIVHFYTVSHLTAVTALKHLDPEFEAVSASLKVPFYKTFWRVTVPVSLPAILDISIYLFVNAMTTVSAVVFLYSADTQLASVAVLNMDDAGDTAPAAAMAMMIVYTAAAVRVLHALATRGIARSTQAWKTR